jgi:hypothetical protein
LLTGSLAFLFLSDVLLLENDLVTSITNNRMFPHVQVRVNALLCLGELVPRLDKVSVAEILKTLRRCTAVDHSAPTLMCTLNVAGVVYKQVAIILLLQFWKCTKFQK